VPFFKILLVMLHNCHTILPNIKIDTACYRVLLGFLYGKRGYKNIPSSLVFTVFLGL